MTTPESDSPRTVTVSTTLSGLIRLLRPRQWIKNGFVLAPLVFAGHFTRPGAMKASLLAMLLFCVASSAVYIINDLQDIERDRRHPTKSRTRPLAAGTVSVRAAWLLFAVLVMILTGSVFLLPKVMGVIAGYVLLNIAYSLVLKHQPVIDIFTIAIGFVLRVLAGAVALNVPLSEWMFVTTLCLALYLASIKRLQELRQSGLDGRKVLEKYSVPLVERYAEMSATGALIFYSLYVMSAQPALVVTVPLVLFGLFRYWYVVDMQKGGESPTDTLVGDWPLLATAGLWFAVCGWQLWPRVA